jgi:hypothetical protein
MVALVSAEAPLAFALPPAAVRPTPPLEFHVAPTPDVPAVDVESNGGSTS